MIRTGLFTTNRSWDIPEEIKYNKQTNTEMNKIEPNNINVIESPTIHNFDVSIHKYIDTDLWCLEITDTLGSVGDMDCESFEEAIEMFNLEVNYIRKHGKLRDTWTEEEE